MFDTQKPESPEELVEALELEHFGVPGMKWGHHKEGGSSGGPGHVRKTAHRISKAWDQAVFESNANTDPTHFAITDKASTRLRADLPRIKKKHSASGGSSFLHRLKNPLSSESKAYRSDVKKAYLKRLEEAANEMTNKHGTHRYTLKEYGVPNTSQYNWKVSVEEIKHSGDLMEVLVHPIFDEDGFITDIEVPNVIEHFGVPGMKWGVHKTQGTLDFNRRFPTPKSRKAEILRARQSVHTTRKAYRKEKDPVKKEKLKAKFLKNPDRATALRMTRGEKIIFGLLYAVGGPVTSPAAATFTLASVGRRRSLEADQGKG